MWQILNVEPTYGVCSICRSHECGLVDGKHQWIHTEALDDTRENIVIGYKCVKLFAENLGITKEVVEKMVYVPPTDEQILHAIKSEMELKLYAAPFTLHDNDLIVADEHQNEPQAAPSQRGKAKPKK